MKKNINFFTFTYLFFINVVSWGFELPKNVFTYDVLPSAVEYFIAPSGNKILFRRILNVSDNGFVFNAQLELTLQNTLFQWNFVINIAENGTLYLASLDDGLYRKSFSTPIMIFPNTCNLKYPFSSKLGEQIKITYVPEQNLESQIQKVVFLLYYTNKQFILTFAKNRGLISIQTPTEIFIPTTLRIFNKEEVL